MKLLILPLLSADQVRARNRLYPFLPCLARAGHEFEVHPLIWRSEWIGGEPRWTQRLALTAAYTRRLIGCARGRGFDLAWIEAGRPPHPPMFCQRLPHGLLPRARVFDLGEAFAERDAQGPELVQIFHRLWRGASGFTTAFDGDQGAFPLPGTPRLELPSALDWSRFRERRAPLAGTRIGWPGPPLASDSLMDLWAALSELAQDHDFELALPEGMNAPEHLPLAPYPYPAEDPLAHWLSFDVALLPALREKPFPAGLAAELLALGVPLVAGNAGAPGRMLGRSGAGYHAESHEEWLFALRKLLGNQDLRVRLGERGREWARSTLTPEALAPSLIEFFQELAKGGPEPSRHWDC